MRKSRWTTFFLLAHLPLVVLAVLGVWALSMDRQMVVDSAAKVAQLSGNQIAREFSANFEQLFSALEVAAGTPMQFGQPTDMMTSRMWMNQIQFMTSVAAMDSQDGVLGRTWPPRAEKFPSIPPWTIQLTPQQRLLLSRLPEMSDDEFADDSLLESLPEIPRQIFGIERQLRLQGDFVSAIQSAGPLVTSSGLGLGDLMCLRSLREPLPGESDLNLFNAIVTHIQLHPSNFSKDILQAMNPVYIETEHQQFIQDLVHFLSFRSKLAEMNRADLRPGSILSLTGNPDTQLPFIIIDAPERDGDPAADRQIKLIVTAGFLEHLSRHALGKALDSSGPEMEFNVGLCLFDSSSCRLEIFSDEKNHEAENSLAGHALARIPLNLVSRFGDGQHFLTIYARDMESLYASHYMRVRVFGGMVAVVLILGILTLALICKNQRRLIDLNEMQKNFVSSVSHELRAPIASLLLLSEGLKEGRVHPESRRQQYFSLMVNECRRLGGLITNILTFSRIDRGISDSRFRRVNIRSLVEGIYDLMVPVAGEYRRSVEWGVDDAVPELLVLDESSIHQALINLVDNALKHTPENTCVHIRVQLSNDAKSAEFIISDQGNGVDAELKDKIFRPFVRAGSELTRETTGIGIGLAIVRHIATSHNGSIRFQNRTEGGCDFIMAIPLNLPVPNIMI